MSKRKKRVSKRLSALYESFTLLGWEKYGLAVCPKMLEVVGLNVLEAIKNNQAVMMYLDNHPDIAAKYKKDQTGEVSYLDLLELAQKEYNEKEKQAEKQLREIETRKLWSYCSSYLLKGRSVMPDESTTRQGPGPLG